MTEQPKDWPTKLRELAIARHTTIKGLSVQLGVSQQYLDRVVKGMVAPSSWLKFRYFGIVGWHGTIDEITELLPDDLAAAIREADTRGLKKLGQAADAKAEKRSKKPTEPKSEN